jgi:hypothetical protein
MGLLRFMSKINYRCVRSIAHELVHHKQNLEGRLIDAAKDGSDGSPKWSQCCSWGYNTKIR